MASLLTDHEDFLITVREHIEVEDTMVIRLVTTDQRALEAKDNAEALQRRIAVLEGRADGQKDRNSAIEERMVQVEGDLSDHRVSIDRHSPGAAHLEDQDSP